MKIISITYSAILVLIIAACASGGLSEEELATLNEAKTIHNEAYAIQGQADAIMAQMAEHKNFMLVMLSNNSESQADEIAPEEVDKIKGLLLEIEMLEEELTNWKAEFIEVEIPGGEEHTENHDGHEHEGDDHDHSSDGPKVEILPNQMLELQKEQRSIIQTIQANAEELLTRCLQYVSNAADDIEK